MNIADFVNALRSEIEASAVGGCLEQLKAPSGRQPDDEIMELSDWYRSLPEADRKNLERALGYAASSVTFGFLCVLDGVRPIEDGPDKGSLELWYQKGGKRILINDPNENFLHDEYNAV